MARYLLMHQVFAEAWQIMKRRGAAMLNYALIFLVLALVTGMFGYSGAAIAVAGTARILFILFLAAAVAAFLASASRK
jgi:uncharacterized membrane protein YtjA (UPF0391 family)